MDVISLFSGAGGLDLGLVRSGHTIVWANDIDRDSCETYRRNIGDHVVCKDISNVPLSKIPGGDVVVGGFPCQGFSLANLLRTVSDDRNKLYRQFLRIVRNKQPKYFLAENVRGILSLGGGGVIKKIVSDFAKAGYRVEYKCFNAADYGVPQARFRVVIAGTRKDLPEAQDFAFPNPTHAKASAGNGHVPEGLLPWVTISEALKGIPEPTEDCGLSKHICSGYKVTNRNFTGHRRTDPGKPSPTILARGNGKGGVCAIQHPQNHRRLSVRESSIIQTFPLDFEFAGAMNSCYRQVGNAVPVLFATHLGMALKAIEANCVKCA